MVILFMYFGSDCILYKNKVETEKDKKNIIIMGGNRKSDIKTKKDTHILYFFVVGPLRSGYPL